jgi:hypothetical protein
MGAREDMAVASLFGGIALANAKLGVGEQQPLTFIFVLCVSGSISPLIPLPQCTGLQAC